MQFHVRAQFNFDPTNEPKCPCPELALQVSKRDIFHVCGNKDEDPLWWQAFKDDGSGHHNSKLAGIIPSKKFIEESVIYFTITFLNRTSRERPKSAPYPRLKNSKRTSKFPSFGELRLLLWKVFF